MWCTYLCGSLFTIGCIWKSEAKAMSSKGWKEYDMQPVADP